MAHSVQTKTPEPGGRLNQSLKITGLLLPWISFDKDKFNTSDKRTKEELIGDFSSFYCLRVNLVGALWNPRYRSGTNIRHLSFKSCPMYYRKAIHRYNRAFVRIQVETMMKLADEMINAPTNWNTNLVNQYVPKLGISVLQLCSRLRAFFGFTPANDQDRKSVV